MQPEPGQ